MTEAIRQSYEQVRDSYPIGEDSDGTPTIGTLWRDSDRWRSQLRDDVNRVMSDETLSDEGKKGQVEAVYQRWVPKITEPAKKAREKANKLAAEYAAKSIPMPDKGSGYTTTVEDATELAAIQNESAAIIEAINSETITEKIAKKTGKQPKNFSEAIDAKKLETLRAYFGDALEVGGVEGKIQCQAVLRAANSLGVAPAAVFDTYRNDNHRYCLDQSNYYQRAAQSIQTEPPNVLAGSSSGGNHWRKGGSPRPLLTGGSKGFLPQTSRRRRPSWK
jgi:hypothetical protein